ncbi:MAG: TetR/AcrR family transcriptional regulator [Endozoicomonas sp.]
MPAAPRKKTTRQSRETRTKAILAAARQVFETHGYEKATVAEIAESVGVVEGTVFSYFPSKRILVLKVMEEFYAGITAVLEDGIKAVEGSTRNRLHYIVWNHLNIVSRNRALCGVIIRESRGLDKALSEGVHSMNRRYTNIVRQVVQQGIDNGEIRPGTSVALVRNTIFGTIEHYLWDLISGSTELDTDTVAESLTSLVFNGIASNDEVINKRDVNQLISKLNDLI